VLRKIAFVRAMSPFVSDCVDSFRDAYASTGMNLIQSCVVFIVAIGQLGWRALARHKPL
jgi:hypothetical protein